MVDSDLRSIVPEWIELLSGPILKGGYDFVAPLYARYKYDGTITNTVTYPLTRALYGHRIRQPIGGDFGVGDLVRHYLTLDDWTDDVSKFGIDIWMTTSALTGGFAVCQTPRGEDPRPQGPGRRPRPDVPPGRRHDPAAGRAQRRPRLPIRGSHDVPAYGFERIIDPPPLEVNTLRLLSEFHAGSHAGDMWASMLSPESLETVMELAAEAGQLGDPACAPRHRRRRRIDIGDDARDGRGGQRVPFPGRPVGAGRLRPRGPRRSLTPLESLVAALVPIYFGRVGSFVIENRHITTDQAEERVERQAREFERLKPYLVQRWGAGDGG